MPRNVCVSCQMDAKDRACRLEKLRLQALLAARHRLVIGSTARLHKVRETRETAKTCLACGFHEQMQGTTITQLNATVNQHETETNSDSCEVQLSKIECKARLSQN